MQFVNLGLCHRFPNSIITSYLGGIYPLCIVVLKLFKKFFNILISIILFNAGQITCTIHVCINHFRLLKQLHTCYYYILHVHVNL